ncbi:type III secretion system cytoplasmic ring protein SctQ [Achromobacter marplatensis]
MNRPAEVPLSLLRMSGQTASAYTRIARYGARLSLAMPPLEGAGPDAKPVHWEVTFTREVDEAVRVSSRVIAHIEWAGARLRLCMPETGIDVWLTARMPDLDLGELPEPLYAAAVEALLDEVLGALGAAGNGPARLLELTLDGNASVGLEHEWMLRLHSVESGMTAFACLSCDALGLMLLAGLMGRQPSTAQTLDTSAIPVRVRALLGATTLNRAHLSGLAARDVVLFDDSYIDGHGELWLTLDTQWGVCVREEHGQLVVTKTWKKIMDTNVGTAADEEANLSNSIVPLEGHEEAGSDPAPGYEAEDGDVEPEEAHPASSFDVDDIPVRLTFDLGERSIAMGTLKTLAPGEIFELDRPIADGCVRVRANGRQVGTGDLVEIDGRIGVMLRSFGAAMP